MFKYFFVLLLPSLVFASRLDPVIFSSKNDAQSSELTSAHTLLEKEEMEENISTNIVDSLREIPGVYISQTGGPGAQASISIRGSEVRHVLVLIDGIKVNDPSNADKQFNFANISIVDIERVEVLKGSQSVLYGSDAIGGVINIITKKGENRGAVGFETGFQRQVYNSTSIYRDRTVVYVNAFYAESDGISAKDNGKEKDGYENKGLTLNITHDFENFEMDWQYKLNQNHIENDGINSSYDFIDDVKPYSNSTHQVFSQKIIKNNFKHTLSLNKFDRYSNFYNTDKSDYVLTNYYGSVITNDFNYKLKIDKGHLVLGLTHEYESFGKSEVNDQKSNLYSAYISTVKNIDDKFFNLGLRSDTHQAFGQYTSFNIGGGLNFEDRKQIKINYATGFKSPTLYQLYVDRDGQYKPGNKNLHPETSRSLDLSYLKNGPIGYSFTLFNSYIDDYINFGSPYYNAGSFHSYGVEMALRQNFNQFEVKEGLTLSKYHLSRGTVYKKPKEKFDFNFMYKITDNDKLGIDYMWVSARKDFGNKELSSYDLWNLIYKRGFKAASIQFGIRNLFDRKYYEAYDYGTQGLTGYLKYELYY